MSGAAGRSATCLADESCQQRSASLVQRHVVKTRVEREAAPLGASVAPAASTPVKLLTSNISDASEEAKVVDSPVAAAIADAVAFSVASSTQSSQSIANTSSSEDAQNRLNFTEGIVAGTEAPPQMLKLEDFEHAMDQQMHAVAAMPTDADADVAVEETMPVNQETSVVDEEAAPQESSRSFSENLVKGLKTVDEFMRGKPQVLNIFVMMLLPAGICAVMCCICNIIRLMEDGQNARDDKADEGAGLAEDRRTLGEVMHSSSSVKVSYEPLCAELLAPGSNNECLIALPSLNELGQNGVSTFERNIVSKTGQPIVTVRVAVSRAADGMPDVAGGGSYGVPGQMLERISLIACKKQNALGFCELRVPSGGVSAARPLKCCIYRPTGDLFATLEEESTGVVSSLLASGSSSNAPRGSSHGGRCYMLTTVATGTRFWIQGDIKERSLVVVSESNEQKPIITVDNGEELQFKREGNSYYRLRVQPKADAGVVIMALFAMDRLSGKQS